MRGHGCCGCGLATSAGAGQGANGALQPGAGQRHDRQQGDIYAAHEAGGAGSPRASGTCNGPAPGAAACEEGSGAEAAWDTELHLPPWVTATEHSQTEQCLDGFVRQLLEARPPRT